MQFVILLLLFIAPGIDPTVPQESRLPIRTRGCAVDYLFPKDAEPSTDSVQSPDHQNRIVASLVADNVVVFDIFVAGKKLNSLRYSDVGGCVEMGWSSDSSQFFITYSKRGAAGPFRTHVFSSAAGLVDENKLVEATSESFQQEVRSKPLCTSIIFIGWTPDSEAVFLKAEVYPIPACGSKAGGYRGYLVEVRSRHILGRYSESETDQILKNCDDSGTLHLSVNK